MPSISFSRCGFALTLLCLVLAVGACALAPPVNTVADGGEEPIAATTAIDRYEGQGALATAMALR